MLFKQKELTMTISEIAVNIASVSTVPSASFQAIVNEHRIFAAGFYDEDGTWFYTWERDRPEEIYDYSLANGRGEEMVRFSRCLDVHGEMSEAEFIQNGLPY